MGFSSLEKSKRVRQTKVLESLNEQILIMHLKHDLVASKKAIC